MHLLELFRYGIYASFIPFHLLLLLLGIFIRALLKTPLQRRIWLAAALLALILCEFGLGSEDIATVIGSGAIAMSFFDLLLGHGIAGLIHGFRLLVDWLNKENTETEEEPK